MKKNAFTGVKQQIPFTPIALFFAIVFASFILMPYTTEAGDDPVADGSKKTKEAKEALQLHERIITLDSHNDTPLRMVRGNFDWGIRHDLRKDHSCVDLPRMKEGGLDGAFFAVFIGQDERTPEGYDNARERTREIFRNIHESIQQHPDLVGLALTPEDARGLAQNDLRIAFIGMENGYPIGKDLRLVDSLYHWGARYITLVHTRNNDLCDSSTDDPEFDGLSPLGEAVVQRMNELGMMIDVSHASDASFYEVLALSNAPVIASHSCARALCDHPRNLDDAMLRALAENGGVVQMCILSDYVRKPDPYPQRDSAQAAVRKQFRNFKDLSDEEMKEARKAWYGIDDLYPRKLATLSDVVDHIDHMVAVAGIDHVGIGTDFDGGGGVDGCREVSEMGNITIELVKRGYTEEEIAKIWGGNLMRVMEENIQQAHKYSSP